MWPFKKDFADILIDTLEEKAITENDKWVYVEDKKHWKYDSERPVYLYKLSLKVKDKDNTYVLDANTGNGGRIELTPRQELRIKKIIRNLAILRVIANINK